MSQDKSYSDRTKQFKTEVKQASRMVDGLENLVTGMGTDADKTTHNVWKNSGRNANHPELTARYREDWIAQKVCNILPQDMTREWRMIDSPEGRQADIELDFRGKVREAYKWARVYGTSCILLDIKGTGAIDKPLNIKRLKPNCIRSLQVIDRTRLFPVGEVDYNPMSPNYGNPEQYILGGSAQRIHSSRILRFEATELPRYEHWRNQWYSDSVLIPLFNTMDNFHTAAQAAAALTMEANADVVTVEGLQNILTNPAGEATILKRFRMMKQMKSVHNIILLDSTEEYNTKTMALSGVKDLIWEYLRVVAAACGIPATRFLSASPDGMNATGESDLNNYVDFLRGQQIAQFDPRVKVLDTIAQAHYGIEPWEYEWNSIFPESSTQIAEREKTQSESLQVMVDSFIISAAEAREILEKRQTYKGVDLTGAAPTPPPEPKPTTGAKNAK